MELVEVVDEQTGRRRRVIRTVTVPVHTSVVLYDNFSDAMYWIQDVDKENQGGNSGGA